MRLCIWFSLDSLIDRIKTNKTMTPSATTKGGREGEREREHLKYVLLPQTANLVWQNTYIKWSFPSETCYRHMYNMSALNVSYFFCPLDYCWPSLWHASPSACGVSGRRVRDFDSRGQGSQSCWHTCGGKMVPERWQRTATCVHPAGRLCIVLRGQWQSGVLCVLNNEYLLCWFLRTGKMRALLSLMCTLQTGVLMPFNVWNSYVE